MAFCLLHFAVLCFAILKGGIIMTRSELLKDSAMTALAAAIATRGIKTGSKVLFGTAITAGVTIVAVDIIAATRKNRSK